MLKRFPNAFVYEDGKFISREFSLGQQFYSQTVSKNGQGELFSTNPCTDEVFVFPGFADVHVHFREPGFSYKEDIASGSRAAAHGGYTAVATMPNLNPPPDSLPHLKPQLDAIEQKACIAVLPYGTITQGQAGEKLSAMAELAPKVIAFSDDGRGVQDPAMMEQAMLVAKRLGKIIAAHCEDNQLLHGGYIHDGAYARAHNHRGICSESEWRQVKRDLQLAQKTGCAYHVCHVSTKESVALIRDAKRAGVDVTCETAPHYLVMDESFLQEDARFKMNPPLREQADREALVQGVLDGTIDMIATDHAPHSTEEKSRGLEKSAMGVVGLETAFPALYTHLVRTGILPLERLVELMSVNVRKRFEIQTDVGFSIWKLNLAQTVDPNTFYTQGRSTPFAGQTLYGVLVGTVYDGKLVYPFSS